jgi:hypothetical protein
MSDLDGPGGDVRRFSPHVALEAHARELTMVEGAVLALSPSLEGEDLFRYNEELEQLHERIDGLSALLGHEHDLDAVAERAAAEFAELGSALDALRREIRAAIRGADISLLRLAADRLCESRRVDVEALLDMCLCDLDELWPLIDLLICRLARGDEDGKCVMARDPSRLTRRVREVCQRTAEQLGEDKQAALHFSDAVSELDEAPDLDELKAVIDRHRRFKESLGRKRLLPGVLRSSVLYSLAVSSRIEALAEDDGELLASLDVDLDELDAPPMLRRLVVQPLRQPAEPQTPPIEDHAGFRAIREALRARLASSTGEPGPAWTIATGADLAKLEETDCGAFSADEASLATPGLVAMIVVGLTAAQRPHIDAELAALEIEPELLEDHWVPEVRAKLRAQIRDLILAGRYKESRTPSEALSRLLPVWAISDGARRRAARPAVQPSISTDLLDLRGIIDETERSKSRRSLGGPALFATLLAITATVMVGRVMVGPMTSAHVLESEELAEISSHLTRAQRDQFGFGRSLFAKVDADWNTLDERQQFKRALEMTRKLRAAGVYNAVISDERKRMRIHIQGGLLHYPEDPSG